MLRQALMFHSLQHFICPAIKSVKYLNDEQILFLNQLSIRCETICIFIYKKYAYSLGTIHKWRHAIFNNFSPPPPPVSHFITKITTPLWIWCHILTSPSPPQKKWSVLHKIAQNHIFLGFFSILHCFLG